MLAQIIRAADNRDMESHRFVSDQQEFMREGKSVPVTADELLKTFNMADADSQTQRAWLQEMADWAVAAGTPSSPILRESIRLKGVTFPE